MTRTVWGYAADEHDDEWFGACATREEAIAEGAAELGAGQEDFFVVSGEFPDFGEFVPCAEEIIEIIRERLDDECCVDGQEVDVTGGTEELNEFLRDWARRNMKASMWVRAGAPERVAIGAAKESA